MKQAAGNDIELLHRYTSLSSLFDILNKKRLTLLNYDNWDDKNDAFYMEKYKERKKLKTVLALCFSEANETYHHWKIYTPQSDGVRITFHRERLLKIVCHVKNVRAERIVYKRIDEINKLKPVVNRLPFMKRLPYKDEKEFRIVYVNDAENLEMKELPIKLGCIAKVTLNPWLPNPLVDAVKATIHSIPDCAGITVGRTGLLENERWKSAAMGR
jgi:hypothetical protein